MCIRGGGLALACVSAVAERRAVTRGCIRGGGARNFGVVHPRGRSVYLWGHGGRIQVGSTRVVMALFLVGRVCKQSAKHAQACRDWS